MTNPQIPEGLSFATLFLAAIGFIVLATALSSIVKEVINGWFRKKSGAGRRDVDKFVTRDEHNVCPGHSWTTAAASVFAEMRKDINIQREKDFSQLKKDIQAQLNTALGQITSQLNTVTKSVMDHIGKGGSK